MNNVIPQKNVFFILLTVLNLDRLINHKVEIPKLKVTLGVCSHETVYVDILLVIGVFTFNFYFILR